MLKYPFLIVLLTVSTLASADDTFEQELRQGCAKVKSSANAGKKLYDHKQYQKALEQFQYQATWMPVTGSQTLMAFHVSP